MSIYARIQNGMVMELFTIPAGSSFTIGQMFHPNLVWIDVTNVSPAPQIGWAAKQTGISTWAFTAPPPPTPPTPAQQAQAALNAGLAIVSTSAPQLNGTYAVDAASQHKISAVVIYATVNQKFPGKTDSYPWLDVLGKSHTFPSTAEFSAFATAVADYVAQLDMLIATGTGTLPTPSVTIA